VFDGKWGIEGVREWVARDGKVGDNECTLSALLLAIPEILAFIRIGPSSAVVPSAALNGKWSVVGDWDGVWSCKDDDWEAWCNEILS
jgi:hypothetical protein